MRHSLGDAKVHVELVGQADEGEVILEGVGGVAVFILTEACLAAHLHHDFPGNADDQFAPFSEEDVREVVAGASGVDGHGNLEPIAATSNIF